MKAKAKIEGPILCGHLGLKGVHIRNPEEEVFVGREISNSNRGNTTGAKLHKNPEGAVNLKGGNHSTTGIGGYLKFNF